MKNKNRIAIRCVLLIALTTLATACLEDAGYTHPCQYANEYSNVTYHDCHDPVTLEVFGECAEAWVTTLNLYAHVVEENNSSDLSRDSFTITGFTKEQTFDLLRCVSWQQNGQTYYFCAAQRVANYATANVSCVDTFKSGELCTQGSQ